MLDIYDCHSVEDCKKLLAKLEGLTNAEYGRLRHLPRSEWFFRTEAINDCKIVIMFYEERKNGIPFEELRLLFFLRHAGSTVFNRFSASAEKCFRARSSVTALFDKYPLPANCELIESRKTDI